MEFSRRAQSKAFQSSRWKQCFLGPFLTGSFKIQYLSFQPHERDISSALHARWSLIKLLNSAIGYVNQRARCTLQAGFDVTDFSITPSLSVSLQCYAWNLVNTSWWGGMADKGGSSKFFSGMWGPQKLAALVASWLPLIHCIYWFAFLNILPLQ